MAHELPYIAAIEEAIRLEMERDDKVLYFGQNIATSENDPFLQAFGSDRVRVTPISETAEIGMAVGAAFAGYRPVVQLYMAEFMLVAMDQVVNEGNRFHYMTAGQGKMPVVREGGDVTIVALGYMLGQALEAAERLAGEGVDAEVIDPRCLAPLDMATVLGSVEKTGRLVIADQSIRHGSAAAVIAAEVASE